MCICYVMSYVMLCHMLCYIIGHVGHMFLMLLNVDKYSDCSVVVTGTNIVIVE